MKLSVVIPTVGRSGPLARTLAALAEQTLPRDDFEIVVVSGAADDFDPELDFPLSIRHLVSARGDVSAKRNLGWQSAGAPLVLFLGDDIIASPRLLEEHARAHARSDEAVLAVLGRIRWARELRPTPFMHWLETGMQFDYGSIRGDAAEWYHFYTANISLPVDALELVDGFDGQRFPFGYEDLDVGYRLLRHGLRVQYNAGAVGDHLHPTSIEAWKARMRAVATAERTWVSTYPEMPAYFHDRFASAAGRPACRGRARNLIRYVPRRIPWLGARVWASADRYYLQQLAPAFLEQWHRDGATT